jgi:hypothetical protein
LCCRWCVKASAEKHSEEKHREDVEEEHDDNVSAILYDSIAD